MVNIEKSDTRTKSNLELINTEIFVTMAVSEYVKFVRFGNKINIKK